MSTLKTAGMRFRAALKAEQPLQIIGAINAYHAMLATQSGFQAIYLSGGGVAAGSLGVPDLGISTLEDVLIDVRRITDAVDTPLLVDIDTGFGGAFNIARSIKSIEKAGAAAVHIEDQVSAKRCGHRPNKAIVSLEEMVDRIKAIDRASACVEAGADMIFPEAMTELGMYKQFVDAVKAPVLANITEFGSTPLFTVDELASADVSMVLYPLSAFRAMNQAALNVYEAVRKDGTQKNVVDTMQTRMALYDHLGYHEFEQKLDGWSYG